MDSHQENFEKVIEIDGDEDGGWVDTHHYAGIIGALQAMNGRSSSVCNASELWLTTNTEEKQSHQSDLFVAARLRFTSRHYNDA